MAKGSETKEEAGPQKTQGASSASTIAVLEGDKTPHDELMKLPKAQIIRSMAVPENKARFMVDVDKQSIQGKRIIALMERLRDGDAVLTETVAEILGALANIAAKAPTSKK